MSEYELEVQRLNTAAYIDSDPTDVAITPCTWWGDGAGGKVWVDAPPLPMQRLRVVTTTATGTTRRTVDGKVAVPEMLLICLWDAKIEPGYRLMINGLMCEVLFVNPDMKYEKLAEVIHRA